MKHRKIGFFMWSTVKPWNYLLKDAVRIKMTCIQVYGQIYGEKKITATEYK